MEHAITVLSLISPKIKGEKWHFACLNLKKNVKPCYCIFSAHNLTELAQKANSNKVKAMLQDTLVFVQDKDTLQLQDLGVELSRAEVILVSELLILFFPTLRQDDWEEICLKLGIRQKKTYCSPAHKKARILWEIIKQCWHKGLNEDLGFISKLSELTKGLSCNFFLELLSKEILKQFPDRPIRTDAFFNVQDSLSEAQHSLFGVEEEQNNEKVPASLKWAERCFEPGGLLSQSFPGYEPRKMQKVMAEAIIDSYDKANNLVIEAGTGTGKTIAYLIPAIWWAKKNEKRVVIATHTINLQEQLCNKDLPLLHSILPFDFKQVLLKGKNNYICLKALLYEKATADFSAQERLVLAGLLSWVRETGSGEFTEIASLQGRSFFWKKYGADNPDCRPGECRFARHCFMLKARKKAENADLVIINHSLLFADIKTNNSILPEYEDLIIDEAHNLYSTALKQLGFEISREALQKTMENLSGGKGSLVSVLKRNIPLWAELYPTSGNWTELYFMLDQVSLQGREITSLAQELFELLQSILGGRQNLRLSRDKLGDRVYDAWMIALENLTTELIELHQNLARLYACLAADIDQLESYRYEVGKNKNEINQIIDGLKVIAAGEEESRVTYLEKSNVLYLKNTAIDIAAVLRDKVFNKNNSTILTSATLTVAGRFDYFIQEIGLENYKVLKLESPFDYEQQMIFCIVKDLPIQHTPEDVLAQKTASFLTEIAKVLNGRTLVLFTSHRYLRLVNYYLRENLESFPLRVLAQGLDGSREILLRNFMHHDKSILLGTSSFWEGVDIPGDSLSCVIMTRLPFWPPDSPVFEAKAKLYEKMGRDPFRELHLPEAIIRFKQGFGRLIRTKEDKGTVILLDDRIITKQYGSHFLKSLPVLTHYRGSLEEIIYLVEKQNTVV
ncbi:MAG: DEAD/DEAH box helicase family protein [Peptococcaceae bacterium]|nr:DEAD/DEAH box helicase family protein [Peptococcaceae bacterium]